jgi:ABC-2 type transport system permease protein
MLRMHVVGAVFWRNLMSYFTSILGYVFLVWFVTSCAVLAFSQQFFAENLANLDQLSKYYPLLLLTLIPAITMGVWADEKRQGTDAILFTLPGSDLDFLLGKYLSVVAVYTVALLFSSVQLIALAWIGNPDFRVIMTTYFGYWLIGLALLSIGMFASSLTKNVTVAYVLGAIFCSIPVLIGYYFEDWLLIQSLSVQWHLESFTRGLISMTGVLYFLSIVVLMLYLNLVVNTRRHWSRGQQLSMSTQFAVRVIAVGVAVISVNVIADRTNATRISAIDFTKERLYSLEQSTRKAMLNLKEDEKTVSLKAFISRDVPKKYVGTKKRLEGLLKQYDRNGGNSVAVEIIYVEPNTDQAAEARTLGVTPRSTQETVDGKVVTQDVYMGIVINGAANDVTLDFVGDDDALEYQISRSISTASDASKQFRIGVLNSDAFFMGIDTPEGVFPWNHATIVEQLKKHYRLERVDFDLLGKWVNDTTGDQTPPGQADEDEKSSRKKPDVLLVAAPSSLPQMAMNNLVLYIQAGNPVLILVDPLPFYRTNYIAPDYVGITFAPWQGRINDPRALWSGINCDPAPKASGGMATELMNALQVDWNFAQVVWHSFQPHQSFGGYIPAEDEGQWPEYWGPKDLLFTFVRPHGSYEAFNREHEVSKGLRELLFFYGGSIAPQKDASIEFTPLVTLEPESGRFVISTTPDSLRSKSDPPDITENVKIQQTVLNQFGEVETRTIPARSQITGELVRSVKSDPIRQLDDNQYVMAAHIHGGKDSKINVIVIADIDFVSDMVIEQQRDEAMPPVDNFAFFKNALEFLAGDTSFISLRNRRSEARTLTRIEETIEEYRNERIKKQSEVEQRIQEKLQDARNRLAEADKDIQADTELSRRQKSQQAQLRLQDEQSLFDQQRRELEAEAAREIEKFKAEERSKVNSYERTIQLMSIGLSPVPVIILGLAVMIIRFTNESRGIDPERRV